jgi:hypothetical protein
LEEPIKPVGRPVLIGKSTSVDISDSLRELLQRWYRA